MLLDILSFFLSYLFYLCLGFPFSNTFSFSPSLQSKSLFESAKLFLLASDLGNGKYLGSSSGSYTLLEISLLFTVVTSFGFSEADTEFVGVVGVTLQSVDAVVPKSNVVVVVVITVASVTGVVVVAADFAGSDW
jgi:hypothetical protein